jgi:LCP family protein required for cell wall assembly
MDARAHSPGPSRTDTMILIVADPSTDSAALISIPRDLWVPIPGHGRNRINTANFFGDADQPGNGPLLAKRVVSENFGVPVQYYVRIRFQGFVDVIDTLGGITVDVPRDLDDDHYPTPDYGTQKIHIAAGVQHMDGETALIYARSRYSTSDFDRARRQQQILLAAYDKLNSPLTWPRLPLVFAAFLSATESDMSGAKMVGFYRLLRDAGAAGRISTLVIGQEFTQPYTTPEGSEVLLPRWALIRSRLARLLQAGSQ